MWKKVACGLCAGILCLSLSCAAIGGRDDAAPSPVKISASEAGAIMDSGQPYVLLDVRTAEEFRESHIRGALLIPYTELKKRAASELPDKDALILVYCRSGRRSAIAAGELVELGFTKVYDFGGIQDWPYEKVSGSGKDGR